MRRRRPDARWACALLMGLAGAASLTSRAERGPTPTSGGGAPERPPARPNVLFLVVDDLFGSVGSMGGKPRARTPHLDRLAARGVLFTNAHCPAPVCHPSRDAVLTGVPPHVSGLYANTLPLREYAPDASTLPQVFRAGGYGVLGAGKIFHYADPDSWDEYFPARKKNRPADPFPPERPASGVRLQGQVDWAPLDVTDDEMGDGQIAAWLCEVLERPHERPFFLAGGFFRPHPPWYVPGEYFDGYPLEAIELPEAPADDLGDVPAAGRHLVGKKKDLEAIRAAGKWREAVRGYLASVTFADAQIGRVLDALWSGPHAETTIVVLWSDHGYHLGEKSNWRKSTLWEVATRVPLYWSVPEGLRGAACDRAVSLMDVFPTLAELCGLELPAGVHGESLVPRLSDPTLSRSAPVLTTLGRGNHAVRSDRYRYIRYADGTEELYDHATDPFEWQNLAGEEDRASVIADLAAWLPSAEAESVKRRRR